LAFTKAQKGKILAQYEEWVRNSKAVYILQYSKMNVKSVEAFRSKVREVGGEAHVVKNTLMKLALERAGYKIEEGLLAGTSLAGFAFDEAPSMAKAFAEAAKTSAQVFQVKVGFLDGKAISPENVKALADLPPLPILRSQILGVLQAPASKLVRTLVEPARQVARVLQAYSEQSAS